MRLIPEDKHLFVDYKILGDMYLKKLNYQKTEEAYLKAMKINPAQTNLLYLTIINAAEKERDFPTALTYYEKYFEAAPDYSSLSLFKYGQAAYYSAAPYVSAKSQVVIDELTDPSLAAENEATFNTYVQKGDKAFADLIVRQPDKYYGYQWRAEINGLTDYYNQLRKKPMAYIAKPYYEAAIEFNTANNENGARNKDLITDYNYLAKYAIDKNDIPSCIDYKKKILEIDPENAQAKEDLEKLLEHQRKSREAAARKAAQMGY